LIKFCTNVQKNLLILNTPIFLGGKIDLKLIFTQYTPVCIGYYGFLACVFIYRDFNLSILNIIQ